MKISASIYSSPAQNLPDLIRELDEHQINFFHLDCLDNPSVFEDIARIREISDTPIDLHIISGNPAQYYSLIEKHRVEYATFQYENLNGHFIPPESRVTQFGLAITSKTPVEAFAAYADSMKFILFMTTEPGQSGGKFNKENFARIRAFKRQFPGKRIHVDGGVNAEISFILRNMGVYAIVSGSYLFNSRYVGAALLNLKKEEVSSHFLIRDFMIPVDELPLQGIESFDFKSAVQFIEKYKYGFTLIVEPDGRLAGIATNADIRRGLIKNLDNLNEIAPEDIINRRPVVIREDRTIEELLKVVKNLRFPVLFLPVVDHRYRLVGAVTFNNLIKGES